MEQIQLDRVAEQYRRDGYVVFVRPPRDSRPEFLRNFELDMIASKGSEHVVVEVKRRPSLDSGNELSYLASEVNAHPGWRFDLVVTDSDPTAAAKLQASTEPDIAHLLRLADTAERLLAEGELEAACLIAWSATEAALRFAAKTAGISLERTNPDFILKTLVAEGVLPRDEYDRLQSVMRTRNAVAHGLQTPALDYSTVRDAIDAARRHLESHLQRNGT